jgi:ubiquinone/menaquinone biosynthesis C-methylase UbiE
MSCFAHSLASSLPTQASRYSFDHVAVNASVIACDMAQTGVDAGALDVAIFSLSLMGSNIEDYLREAHRVLKLDGRLKIAEPRGHWDGAKRGQLTEMITAAGFAIIGQVQVRGAFLYLDAMKA